MSGFSADWLALREPADRAARSPTVLAACRAHFAAHEAVRVCDLGSGTGAAVPAFSPYLPARQHWILVDNDPANLAEAKRLRQAGAVTVQPLLADLAVDPAPWPDGCDLVTATALFDLAGPAWIERLCARLAAARLPLLATLTYNGVQRFSVSHSADAAMLAAFNRHQRLDKGLGGPAAGPEAGAVLAAVLEKHGYRVTLGESPWQLDGARDHALIAELLRGWAAAVAGAGFVPRAEADAWLAAHVARADALSVGHTDIFALPG